MLIENFQDFATRDGAHMVTSLSIDLKLIERAMRVSCEPSADAVVTTALQEYIARREQKRLLALFGTLEWDESYDYKVERMRL